MTDKRIVESFHESSLVLLKIIIVFQIQLLIFGGNIVYNYYNLKIDLKSKFVKLTFTSKK